MDILNEFLTWAWVRHQNPLSWYVRPLFVLPFCYFAYRKNIWGIALTIIGVATSMFWFPAPETPDTRVTEFLAMERTYVGGGWTLSKTLMTALIPAWFVALALAFWRRSWLAGFVVINLGALLKTIWSFYFAGTNATAILAPVILGLVVCNVVLLAAHRKVAAHSVEARG